MHLPRLRLLSKTPCPLCDQLKSQIIPYLNRCTLEAVDITAPQNKHLKDLFQYDIPVLFLEAKFVCKHRLDESALERALKDTEEEWTHLH